MKNTVALATAVLVLAGCGGSAGDTGVTDTGHDRDAPDVDGVGSTAFICAEASGVLDDVLPTDREVEQSDFQRAHGWVQGYLDVADDPALVDVLEPWGDAFEQLGQGQGDQAVMLDLTDDVAQFCADHGEPWPE